MANTLQDAKQNLDKVIYKARVDFYKPIQIAEVLYQARIDANLDVSNLEVIRKPSIHWRDEITVRFTGKKSTSSARYQDNVWDENAMPPRLLAILDTENKRLHGAVERYIYRLYFDKQKNIAHILYYITHTPPEKFDLKKLLKLFTADKGLRRSTDKAYEIIAYSLFETLVVAAKATIKLEVPQQSMALLREFADLVKVLLGLESCAASFEMPAHIYRVGVTNAADRGLDMWANFGIAIQVKHLTLNKELAASIVDQVESDNIVIVCTDADAQSIETITRQIGWGKRVRGIVKESDLILWYNKCLRGQFADELAIELINQLLSHFDKEFPILRENVKERFFAERGYDLIAAQDIWG